MFPSLSSYLFEKGETKRERETDRQTDADTASEFSTYLPCLNLRIEEKETPHTLP